MAKPKAGADVLPLKDEDEQQQIPTAWRPAFREIVNAFVRGDYRLADCVAKVAPVTSETATQIEGYLSDYGETLVALPEDTWESSICMWMGKDWEVLIDLWTQGEGRSDLVLSARASEVGDDIQFTVEMVYVP